MKTGASLKNRQGGTAAIVVGISMVMLIGFLALVIDLGHLYIAKTELQNAADAAALAGAKELNGKASGVASAVTKATEIAAQNRYDFSKPVDITVDNVSVGNCPDPGCFIPALNITDGQAANKYFIKVDTGSRTLATWFAPILNIFTTDTFGMAVAGRYLIDITPLAMCALDLDKCPDLVSGTCATPPCECGYDRGKPYKVSDINPIGPGTLYWLDPLATTPPCTITNADDMRPFICQGKASVATTAGSYVYTNTGVSSGPTLGALDSRFNDYPSAAQCDPATAPPDTNVREYRYTDATVSAWMNPPPTKQAATVTSAAGAMPITTDWSGVVWSYVRPPSPNTTGRNVNNPPYLNSPWTPYTNLVTTPTGGGAAFMKENRRVMNLVIVACATPGGVCRPAQVRGIGEFLLQRRADAPSDKEIYVEFGQFVPGGPNVSEYKLYR